MNLWDGKTVLIVDDSPAIRMLLKSIYSSMGITPVGEACNGVEAINFLKENQPDIISLDIIMPEMDGIECYRKIKSANQSQKIIIVSCLSADAGNSFNEEIPSYIFSQKPFTKETLEASLRSILKVDAGVEGSDSSVDNSGVEIPDINHTA